MDYKKYNDYELIYMIRENDDNSKDIMYNKYLPIIKNICNEFYQKYSNYGYEYDDFLQEGYIAFQKSLMSYDSNKKCLFYSFVILCIRRRLLSFSRSISSAKKNSFINAYDIDDFDIIDENAYISHFLNDLDIENKVHDLILKLSLDYSSVLELKWDGFRYKEICSLLEISRSTLDYRIRKIRNELKKCFKDN